jgi:hypothetical protein
MNGSYVHYAISLRALRYCLEKIYTLSHTLYTIYKLRMARCPSKGIRHTADAHTHIHTYTHTHVPTDRPRQTKSIDNYVNRPR